MQRKESAPNACMEKARESAGLSDSSNKNKEGKKIKYKTSSSPKVTNKMKNDNLTDSLSQNDVI